MSTRPFRLVLTLLLLVGAVALTGCPPAECEDEGGDTDNDGVCDDTDVCAEGNDANDDDGDGVPNACDVCPDDAGDDTDGDGSCDGVDLCEGDDGTLDMDDDGVCGDLDPDDDGDGCLDADDLIPTAPGPDLDLDGISSHCDLCTGDDTSGDTDGDGDCNDVDADDDNDGCSDLDDSSPLIASTDDDGDGYASDCDFCIGDDDRGDFDEDGTCDDLDEDDDNDGCPDLIDPNPYLIIGDLDLDGIDADCDQCFGDDAIGDSDGDGDCDDVDLDDDADGCDDVVDAAPNTPSVDEDGDGVPEDCDSCEGSDGIGDSDGDGVCDDLDIDDDDDGCADAVDGSPLIASADIDGDGYGADCDICDGDDDTGDIDGDGTCDDIDLCNGDQTTGDTDGDGYCDDIDVCDGDDDTGDADGDGVCDDLDLCTGDDTTGDTDADGACDDTDDDDDGDTCLDVDDAAPLVPSGDADADTIADDCDLCIGDNAAGDADADTICDGDEPPAAPTDLTATVSGDDVVLTWTNPASTFTSSHVVVARQMVAMLGATPADGAAYAVASAFGLSGEVIYVGSDATFTDVDPGPGFASYSVFAVDLGDNASSQAYDEALLEHGAQVITFDVDLTTGAITTTAAADDVTVAGLGTHNTDASTLTLDLEVSSAIGRYLHSPKLLLTSSTVGVFDSADDSVDGVAFQHLGPAALVPGVANTPTVVLTGIDGTVDPVSVTVELRDDFAIFSGARWDDGLVVVDSSGVQTDTLIECEPLSYNTTSGDCMFMAAVVSKDGRFVYATQRTMPQISIIDTATLIATAGVTLGAATNPSGDPVGSTEKIELSEDGRTLWVVLNDGQHGYASSSDVDGDGSDPLIQLISMDALTLAETGRVTLHDESLEAAPDYDVRGKDLALSADESTAAVPLVNGSAIVTVDLDTMTVLSTIDVSASDEDPHQVAFSADGATLYVAYQDSGLESIELATSAATPIVGTDGERTGDLQVGLDGDLWVSWKSSGATSPEGLVVVDLAAGTETVLSEADDIGGFSLDPTGTVIWAIGSDDGELLAFDATTLVQLDTDGDTTDASVGEGYVSEADEGHAFAVTPF